MHQFKKQVRDLQVGFCNQIENTFLNNEVIEFNSYFTIYLSTTNTYDDSLVKDCLIVKTLTEGKYLSGEDPVNGTDFEEVSIYDLEDIIEVAHILDEVTAGRYKVLTFGDDSEPTRNYLEVD